MVPTAPEVAQERTASGGSADRRSRPGDGPTRSTWSSSAGGPGGYATALYGAAAGLSIAIVELDKVGGTCLHRGCVPAKEFLETASVFRTVAGAGEFGITAGRGQPIPPWSTSR